MKLLLLAAASLAISSAHAYDDASSTTSLRGGGLDFLASPSNLNRISCKWSSGSGYDRRNIVGTCANRSDDKPYPYQCEDGRYICCDASYINEPNLDNFGKCTRVAGGPPPPRRPTPAPRPTPNRPPTPRRPTRPTTPASNSIHCIAPDQRRFTRESHRGVCDSLDPDHDVPYSCNTGSKLCCTNSKMTNVRLDKFGQCHKIHYPNEEEEEEEKKDVMLDIEHDVKEDEEEDDIDEEYIARTKRPAEIHCIAPNQKLFERRSRRAVCARQTGHNNVPYSCDGGTELCCTHSSMTKVTFNKFGYCEKVQLDEGVGEEEDSVNFLDEEAQVKCYGPPGSRPCPAGRIPYTCAAGEEMCCEWSDLGNVKTRTRNRRQGLKNDFVLPGHGLCTRDDIPTAASEDQVMILEA